MSLFQTIQTERREALGTNRTKYNLYGVIISELQRTVQTSTSTSNISDTDCIKVLKKLLESVSESLSYADNEQLQEEKVLLEKLIPKQLSSDELLEIMKNAIANDPSLAEKKNMFPYLKSKYDGLYNGKDANLLFSKLTS